MKGLLIVCEGIDCSGKTTAINRILNKNKRFIYNKGIGSESSIGKTSRRFPSTFMFFIELLWSIITKINPNLKKRKIVLQDRYDISITSYVPLANKGYNKLIAKIFKKFIIKPDAIIYFHLPLKERIKRLKQKNTKYESLLVKNPHLIKIREKEYLKWYNNFKGPKIKINTKKNNIKQTAERLKNFTESLLKNSQKY